MPAALRVWQGFVMAMDESQTADALRRAQKAVQEGRFEEAAGLASTVLAQRPDDLRLRRGVEPSAPDRGIAKDNVG